MSNALSMPGSGSKYKIEDESPATFLSGLWHGLLMPLFFLIILFNPNVSIYETNNNHSWYHFGLLMGVWAFAGNTIHLSIGSTVF
ncbi:MULTISPECIES: hypothetical protein [Rheinheimera]|uniref:hypothetical protein n=1 Tax=Rheinheimera TaxID=67575 RepID=UPI00105175E9|nr:hypothetical protein [Rheinheimera sp. D18]QBL09492.1 hypothetical protein E0Z06_08215 [Rheinheimera sp. D18]